MKGNIGMLEDWNVGFLSAGTQLSLISIFPQSTDRLFHHFIIPIFHHSIFYYAYPTARN
jgi:hypothetical protein